MAENRQRLTAVATTKVQGNLNLQGCEEMEARSTEKQVSSKSNTAYTPIWSNDGLKHGCTAMTPLKPDRHSHKELRPQKKRLRAMGFLGDVTCGIA
jgi:hypothetical protein